MLGKLWRCFGDDVGDVMPMFAYSFVLLPVVRFLYFVDRIGSKFGMMRDICI